MNRLLFFIILTLMACTFAQPADPAVSEPIRYVPVGDSLTSGHGVLPEQAWPSLLAEHLQAEGVDIHLVENLARSGWTTQEALEGQLPRFIELQPTFATLLIGANDLFAGEDPEVFRQHFVSLLAGMLDVLGSPKRLVVMTVPDYTRTPIGFIYGQKEGFKEAIAQYNQIIREEAKLRDVQIVDMHKESKWVMFDVGLLAEDGIHPSAKGHVRWEEEIYKVVRRLLK